MWRAAGESASARRAGRSELVIVIQANRAKFGDEDETEAMRICISMWPDSPQPFSAANQFGHVIIILAKRRGRTASEADP